MSRVPPAEMVLCYADGRRRVLWSTSASELLPIVENEARCEKCVWKAPVRIELLFRKRRELTEIYISAEIFCLLETYGIQLSLKSEGGGRERRLFGSAKFQIWSRSPDCTPETFGALSAPDAPVTVERTEGPGGLPCWNIVGRWRPVVDVETFTPSVLDRWQQFRPVAEELARQDAEYHAEVGFEFSAGSGINYMFTPEIIGLMLSTRAALHLFIA